MGQGYDDIYELAKATRAGPGNLELARHCKLAIGKINRVEYVALAAPNWGPEGEAIAAADYDDVQRYARNAP